MIFAKRMSICARRLSANRRWSEYPGCRRWKLRVLPGRAGSVPRSGPTKQRWPVGSLATRRGWQGATARQRLTYAARGSGPAIDPQRAGIGTLIVAGPERLLFDVGRGVPGLSRMGIVPADVTKVFLTHLHSDHVIALPKLYLYPWASQGRTTPFEVWGPEGGHEGDDAEPPEGLCVRYPHQT